MVQIGFEIMMTEWVKNETDLQRLKKKLGLIDSWTNSFFHYQCDTIFFVTNAVEK